MYDSTFEGGMIALLNAPPATPVESAYEKHLREAWAAYDTQLDHLYRKEDDHG